MAELREVAAILDAGKIEEAELNTALQALLFHQCLYEDWPHPPSYRLISRHLVHIKPIMAALGFTVAHRMNLRMIVLEPGSNPYGLNMTRLKKDETVILLALRLLYAEGLTSIDEAARVEITTDDVHNRLRSYGEEPPSMARLLDILRLMQRKGLVRIGDKDSEDQVAILTIMPGVTALVSDVYVEAIQGWLDERASLPGETGSMLAHVAAHRAALGTAGTATDGFEAEAADEAIEDCVGEAADVQA